jgi:hypothetical protein
MKQKFFLLCMGLWISISVLAYTGSGTEVDPYLISSQADMVQLAADVKGGTAYSGTYFLLTQDLARITTVIGDGDHPFSGVFDGGGHVLTVAISTEGEHAGVFGYAKGAEIKNLGVAGSVARKEAAGTAYAGGICGVIEKSRIDNCYNTADISAFSSAGDAYSGGIGGDAYNYSSINNCYNTGNVSSAVPAEYGAFSGGICGDSFYHTTISNCYNSSGTISSPIQGNATSGGICGSASNESDISNCFVTNSTVTGGSAGRVAGGAEESCDLTNNYALGEMLVNGSTASSDEANTKDGQDATEENFKDLEWLDETLEWNIADDWYVPEGETAPVLKVAPALYLDFSSPVHYGDVLVSPATSNSPGEITYESSCSEIVAVAGDQLTVKKLGTVTITASQVSAAAFTSGTTSIEITIEKRPLQVRPNDASHMYGATNSVLTLSYEGFANGDTEAAIATKPVAKTAVTTDSPVGRYPITCSGGSATNYSLVYQTGTLTVTKRTLRVTPVDVSRAYGDANPAFTLVYSGFMNGNTVADIETELVAETEAVEDSEVGAYLITCSGGSAANYDFACKTGTLTVTKATLVITANDTIRRQGEENPDFTLAYSGFKNDESEAVLDVLPMVDCAAERSSPVGFYDIVLSGGEDKNYDYQLVNGRLEITLPDGIEDVAAAGVSIYPNPVRSELFIRSDSPVRRIEICHLSGIRIAVRELVGQSVSLADLPKGIYLVRIATDAGVIVRKIRKE